MKIIYEKKLTIIHQKPTFILARYHWKHQTFMTVDIFLTSNYDVSINCKHTNQHNLLEKFEYRAAYNEKWIDNVKNILCKQCPNFLYHLFRERTSWKEYEQWIIRLTGI